MPARSEEIAQAPATANAVNLSPAEVLTRFHSMAAQAIKSLDGISRQSSPCGALFLPFGRRVSDEVKVRNQGKDKEFLRGTDAVLPSLRTRCSPLECGICPSKTAREFGNGRWRHRPFVGC